MWCTACGLVRRVRLRVGVRAAGSRSDADSPLKRLLSESSSWGEAAPAERELQWATQPYAAPAPAAAPPAAAPADATVLLFPGQGAERVGMGRALKDIPAAMDLYKLASEIVGWDVWKVCTEGPAQELSRRVQVCVCVSALAGLERAREERPGRLGAARAAAGFSLGEVAALVWAGSLSLEAALRFLELRTTCMQAAAVERPGGMLTVWLAPDANLKQALRRARDHAAEQGVEEPVAQIANYLYPACKVIAGDEEALKWLEKSGSSFGLRRCARVRTGGAWHCSLMQNTVEPLRAALDVLDVREPRLTVLSCIDAKPYKSAHGVRRGLSRLASRPVRWEQTLHALYARPPHTPQPHTLALGPGTALKATLKQVNAKAADNALQIDV